MDWLIPAHEINGGHIIGSGSFGRVYLKEWRRTKVAVKVIEETNALTSALFKREFDVMTKMHHTNIVQLLGFIDEPFAIVMEYLPGGSLADRRRMRVTTKKKVALDIIRGLAYMHNRVPHTCIHRDIKPRNILFTPSGTAKIADLGLSKMISRTYSNNNLSEMIHSNEVGTRRYSAPETLQLQPIYDSKIDIYSAGIVFYEMFENTVYFTQADWSTTPYVVRQLVKKMIDFDPTNRPTALECYDKIEEFKPRWCVC